MQYKMMNLVLEVAMALQPKGIDLKGGNLVDELFFMLMERKENNELTVKQSRVLNAMCTIRQGENKRLERSKRIRHVCVDGCAICATVPKNGMPNGTG